MKMDWKDLHKMLDEQHCFFHHSATTVGYLSRKEETAEVEEYHGKFGDGYKVMTASWISTRYINVTYYIKEA